MLNKRGTPTPHAACRRWGSERCASGGITGASGISMDWFSRENLQESPILNGKIHGFRLRSPKPIHWESPAKSSSCCSWTSQISCGSRRSFTAPGPMYEMLSHETAAGLAGTQNTFGRSSLGRLFWCSELWLKLPCFFAHGHHSIISFRGSV